MQEKKDRQVRSLSLEDPLEEGMATHPQYSCLKNPMDRGSWWATVHRVTKSNTQRRSLACIHIYPRPRYNFRGDSGLDPKIQEKNFT